MTHPPLGLTCPVVRKCEKSWCSAVEYIEQLNGVVIVEQNDAGKRTRVATENEEERGIECGEGMPCNSVSLGRNGGVLRTRDILPWWSGGIELGREGEVEEIVVPRSGSVSIRVVRVCFTAEHEKGIVDDSDGLSPSEKLAMSEKATERQTVQD